MIDSLKELKKYQNPETGGLLQRFLLPRALTNEEAHFTKSELTYQDLMWLKREGFDVNYNEETFEYEVRW